ncbi:MAG: hypothetical protein AB8H80_03450 [Planctomycetota bacterium]
MDDRVDDVLGSGGVFYAAGRFQNAIPLGGGALVPRTGVVAWDARSGQLLPWAPTIVKNGYDYRVDALGVSPDGLTIYVGGLFDTVDGQPRKDVVAVDLQGQVTSWRARSLNVGRIKAIEVSADGSRIYLAGIYGIQAYSTTAGSQQPDPAFAPDFRDAQGQRTPIWSMVLSPDQSILYTGSGGMFRSVNGVAREGLAAVDAATGATLPFNPGLRDPLNNKPYVEIWDVSYHDGQVYAYGDWWQTRVNGVWRGSGQRQLECVRFDPATGNADETMLPWADGGFQGGVIDPIRNKIYGVGHFDRVAGPDESLQTAPFRKDLCIVDLADGSIRAWRPGSQHSTAASQLYGVDMAAGRIAVAGEFEVLGQTNQRNIGMFDLPGRRALFVVGDPAAMQPLDRFVYGRLERHLGFDVTLQDDDLGDGSEADGMDCVVISNSASWANLLNRYRDTESPLLTWNASLQRRLGLTRGWWNVDSGVEPLSSIDIADPSHPIVRDFSSSQVSLYGSAYPVVWGQPVAAAEVIATTPNNRPTLFTVRAGEALWDRSLAAGSRLVFPMRREYGTTAPDVSHELWALFDASIEFLMDGRGDAVQRLTSGCADGAMPLLEVDRVPRIGRRFDVDLFFAPANQAVVLGMDFDQSLPLAVTSTCSAVSWSTQAMSVLGATNAFGREGWSFPMGLEPSMIYQTFHLQAMIAQVGGPMNGTTALSEGYRVRIQP